MRRVLFVVLLVVIGAAAGLALRGRQSPAPTTAEPPPPAVPVEVAKAEVGDVAQAIEVSGTVVSARTAEIFPKIGGRVARVYVQDGARVAAGQPLVALDASDQRADVAQAQAAVAAAEARLALLESGLRDQERQVVFNAFTQAQSQVKGAETQVTLSQASLRVAEDNLRRHELLLREGAIAQVQVDQMRLQRDQARAQLEAAQTQLEIARTALDSARQQWNMTEAGARTEELQLARAQVAQARAVAALARQRLASMIVRAPFTGRVAGLSVTVGDFLTSGDFAARGAPLARVYDEGTIEVEVKVGERDIGQVRVGQPATLHLEGAPEEPVAATVRLISPAADPMSRTSSVRLRLTAAAAAAVPGTFARGEILLERRTGVVLVPRTAVTQNGEPTVRVVTGDVVAVRAVALGLSQNSRIEVRSGVEAGEEVVVLGPESLPAGTRVRVVNR